MIWRSQVEILAGENFFLLNWSLADGRRQKYKKCFELILLFSGKIYRIMILKCFEGFSPDLYWAIFSSARGLGNGMRVNQSQLF